MSLRRSRLLAAFGLLAVAAMLWGVVAVAGNADRNHSQAANADEPSNSLAVPSSSSVPIPVEKVAVQPEVQQAISEGRDAPVILRLAVDPSGTDDERIEQVRVARDRFLGQLPEGSWSEAKDTGTLPFLALTVDRTGFEATRSSGLVAVITDDSELITPISDVEPMTTLDPSSINSTATMGAVSAWAAGWKGAGATVAVIDTGVQTDHPYLMRGSTPKTIAEACFAYSCASGASMKVTDAPLVGAATPCPATVSNCTHGTHVAGIAVGGDGTTIPSGVAPDANLIAINVFSQYLVNGVRSIGAATSDINTALDWLYYNRARFPGLTSVNLSLGGGTKYTDYCDNFSTTKFYIDQLLTIGVSTVVAAGNGSYVGGVSWPACISTAVAVGSVDGVPDQFAGYSNVGSQVDLVAPGSNITSSLLSSKMGGMSGTSMATPAVAGALAVLRQLTPDKTLSRLRESGVAVSKEGFTLPSVRLADAISIYPGPVRSVATTTDTGKAIVSWQAPVSSGSTSIIRYVVSSLSGEGSCTTVTLTCEISGLTDGADYVFVVRAESVNGLGASVLSPITRVAPAPATTTTSTTSVPSTTTTTTPSENLLPPVTPTSYHPVAPVRLSDTRSAAEGALTVDGQEVGRGALSAGSIDSVQIAGRGDVPVTGVEAVALNVTVVDPSLAGFVSVYPTGEPPPSASSLNFAAGQTIPNMVLSKLGTDGSISIFNGNGSVHVVVDVVGWFSSAGGYGSLKPARIVDTRSGVYRTIDGGSQGIGAIGAGRSLSVSVLGRGGVPATRVSAVVVNLVAANAGAAGHLTVYPGQSAKPNASNLNFVGGQTIANMAIAKVGSDGTIAIANGSSMPINVVVDVVGWFDADSQYTSLDPARLFESRDSSTIDGRERNIGPIAGGQTIAFTVTGRRGGPPTGARVVALNVTVAEPTASGYLTVFAPQASVPKVSNLNFVAGQIIPNLVIAEVGIDGKVALFNSAGSTPVFVDVVGWFP
ncbi:MAG: S8 family serine peptidase [Actinomycetes bacterium]